MGGLWARWSAAFMLGVAAASGPAAAQEADCAALRARIDAGSRQSGTSAEWADAVRQQRHDLERTRAYADSLGCGDGLFGDSDSSECEPVTQDIRRLEDNLARLREQAQAWSLGQDERRALTDQYTTECVAPRSESSGISEGIDIPQDGGPDTLPAAPGQPRITIDPDAPPAGRKVSKALCVRQCDGAFFPLAYHASPDQFDDLGRLCQAQCPNAQASLYTTDPGADVDTAVAADGSPYTALPAAFKYRKTLDATCSCKRADQSWTEALAAAEALLERDKTDVTVTPQMSDAMSRPVGTKPANDTPGQDKVARPPSKHVARRAKAAPRPGADTASQGTAEGVPDTAGNPGEDLTRQIRTAAPTL